VEENVQRITFPDKSAVLFIDFMKDRHTKFLMNGRRTDVVRYCADWDAALFACKSGHWDAIFHPGYVPKERDELALAKAIVENTHKPILVVYHGLSPDLGEKIHRIFSPKGILLARVPWNYDDPSVHRRLIYKGVV
jgi:hypothetical protein